MGKIQPASHFNNFYLTRLYDSLPKDQDKNLIPHHLYKYRDWRNDNHKKIITQQQVYFASIDNLDDPSEGKIAIRYDLEPYDNTIRQLKEVMAYDRMHYDEKELKKNVYTIMKSIGSGNNAFMKYFHDENYVLNCRRGGIFSLSEKVDIDSMWTHYSNAHTGFAVEFDTYKLEDYFISIGNRYGICTTWLKVNYVDKMPNIIPSKLKDAEYFSETYQNKLRSFEANKEYRSFLFDFPNTPLIIPKETISAIYFGIRMVEEDKEDIISTIKRCNIQCEVFEINMNYSSEKNYTKINIDNN